MLDKVAKQRNEVDVLLESIAVEHKLHAVETVISNDKVFVTFKKRPHVNILAKLPKKCGKLFVIY